MKTWQDLTRVVSAVIAAAPLLPMSNASTEPPPIWVGAIKLATGLAPSIFLASVLCVGLIQPRFAQGAIGERSVTELMRERDKLQANLDEMGARFEQKGARMQELEQKFNSLELKKSDTVQTILELQKETEDIEAQSRTLEARQQALEADRSAFEAEVAQFDSYCNGTFEEPEYSRRLAECTPWEKQLNARVDSWNPANDRLNNQFSRLERQYNQVVEQWQAEEVAYNAAENEQQTLATEGAQLQQEMAELAQQGNEIQQRILELTTLIVSQVDSPCDPDNFATPEAFEECVRKNFGEGPGPDGRPELPKAKKFDQMQSAYDLDPNVVKPDWDSQ